MQTKDTRGFVVHSFRNLINRRVVTMDDTVPLSRQDRCPACATKLSPMIAFVSGRSQKHMDVGFCKRCGYQGYMDRPTSLWMSRFYTEEWDNAQHRSIAKKVATLRTRSSLVPPVQQAAISLVEHARIPADALVCDIGCGNGAVLDFFGQQGFTNLLGIEHSLYRVALTRALFGHDVVAGGFEDDVVQAAIRERGKVGLFFSFHVFEHVYEPLRLLQLASMHQRIGDYFILSVPDGAVEPPHALFWLPHLHSFTNTSVAYLFARAGYKIVASRDDFSHNIMVLAQKVSDDPIILTLETSLTMNDVITSYFPTALHDALSSTETVCLSWGKSSKYHLSKKLLPRWLDRLFVPVERLSKYILRRGFHVFRDRNEIVFGLTDRHATLPGHVFACVCYKTDIQLIVR